MRFGDSEIKGGLLKRERVMVKRIHFVFIHGVGKPGPNLFGQLLRANLTSERFRAHTWTEIDWHQAVEQPFPESRLWSKSEKGKVVEDRDALSFPVINGRQIRQLARGIVGSATLSVPETPWDMRFAVFLLWLLTLVSPVFFLISAFLLAAAAASTDLLLLRVVASPFLLLKLILIPEGATPYCLNATMTYASAVTAVALYIPLSGAMHFGWSGFWTGLRQSVLLLIWPFLVPTVSLFLKAAPFVLLIFLLFSIFVVKSDGAAANFGRQIPLWDDGTPRIPTHPTLVFTNGIA
jgi:hypothetical protein